MEHKWIQVLKYEKQTKEKKWDKQRRRNSKEMKKKLSLEIAKSKTKELTNIQLFLQVKLKHGEEP